MRSATGKTLAAVLGLAVLGLGGSGCAVRDAGADAGEAGGSETGDGDGDTGELPAECVPLLPEPAPDAMISFTIRNERSEPIYIDPRLGCGSIPFWLLDPDGDSRTWWAADCVCPCAAVMSDPDEGCECPAACEQPALERIEVGGTWTIVWDGLSDDPVALPATCAANPDMGFSTCDATRAAEAGEWTVALGVWPAAADCLDTDCACAPGEDHCSLYSAGGGELLELSVPFTLPAAGEVVIAVD